ncbi:MAG: hypothetical protein U0745_02165 [Polyangia bacterium]
MPSQLQLLQQATMRLDVKASIWLSRLRVVPKFVPILDIRNMVSPATRKLIDDPPPQSSWMPGAAIIELDAALYDLRGADACARCSRECSEVAGNTILRSITEGMLRLFGTSPATLFERMNQVVSTSVRGVEYVYTAQTAKSGRMLVRYPQCSNLPHSVFVAISGGLAGTFGFLGLTGSVAPPDANQLPPRSAATYLIRW